MNSFPFRRFLGLAVALVSSAHAQLFIDAAGPRNIVFGQKGDSVPFSDRVDFKLDSEAKSATAAFIDSRHSNDGDLQAPIITRGFLIKAAGVNTWEDLLKNNSAWEGTALWNYTNARSPGDKPIGWRDGPWFYNVSASFQHAKLALRSTGIESVRDVNANTGRGNLGLGRQFGYGRNGVAFSAGFARGNNYYQLTKVRVNGRDVREGGLEEYDTYPLSLVVTHQLPGELIDSIITTIPGIDTGTEKGTHGAIVAAYGRYISASHAPDVRTFGLNLTISKKLEPTEKDKAAAKAVAAKLGVPNMPTPHLKRITYPISVFVEWEKPYGRETDRKTGVAMVFTWP